MQPDEHPPAVRIGERLVHTNAKPYVIAELSANHSGALDTALAIVDHAADAGADAIKLQTYTPDTMTLNIDRPPFVVGPGSPWAGRTLYDLYAEAQTPWDWHPALFARAAQRGLDCFSTPFDTSAIDFLEQFDPPAYKIASFELLDTGLIEAAASTGRPVIISTGMAQVHEIDDAVRAARRAGGQVVLLRCNSAYPADPAEMDLATVPAMAERWNVPVGLSDHTLDNLASTVAAALGACVFEKHLTDDRSKGGPDESFSLEPREFAEFVTSVHAAATARGRTRFGPSAAEGPSLAFRRSLYVVADLRAGEILTIDHVRALRPAGGIPPKELAEVLGRRVVHDVKRGTPLSADLVQ